ALQARPRGRWLSKGDNPYYESPFLPDRPPFEDLYRDYLGRIYAYVRAQVGTAADAEDITAQGFMNAYQAYGRFEPRHTSRSACRFRIARTAWRPHCRAGGRREKLRRTIEHHPVAEEDPAGMA